MLNAFPSSQKNGKKTLFEILKHALFTAMFAR